MSVKSLGASVAIGGVAMLVMPFVIRSIVPAAAPIPTEPHVSATEAFCVVSSDKTRAVIVEAATREVMFELRNGTREGSFLKSDAGEQSKGSLSVAFDQDNRPLKCTYDDRTYVISWRGGYNFGTN